MQYLKAEIPIPENCVIITKVEYEELKKAQHVGDTLTLEEFADCLNRSTKWVVDSILKNPKFKKRIDVKNGGFVHYPVGGGDSYSLLKTEALNFIESNFKEIMKGGSA